jgi:hypothetical protein
MRHRAGWSTSATQSNWNHSISHFFGLRRVIGHELLGTAKGRHSQCWQCGLGSGSHAPEIIRLTIQTAAKFDCRSKSGALAKMSFSLDIAHSNAGGLCWYDVSANPLAGLISPGLPLGLTPGKRRTVHQTTSGDASPSPGASTKPSSPS